MAITTTKNKIVTGFILRMQPYREHDHLIHVISEELGKVSFVVRGSQKMTSKSSVASLVYAKVRFRFDYLEQKTMFTLHQREVMTQYPHIHTDLSLQLLLQAVQDLVYRCEFDDAALCCAMLEHIYSVAQAGENAYFAVARLLAYAIACYGVSPNLDACVQCGRSDQIASFQIEAGGFGCRTCFQTLQKREDLVALRHLCLVPFEQVDFDEALSLDVLSQLVHYLQHHLQISLKSFAFFLEMERLKN
ncbi:MAG: DNA repair protein RecO [Erysipelotrichaceae bacterium]